MNRRLILYLIALSLLCVSSAAWCSSPVKIEILYMNHGPLQDTLAKLQTLFSGFGGNINVSWYDFESSEGETFKVKKSINGHVPLVIWINGSTKARVGQQDIVFWGFPTGAGPAFFQGKWSMDTLKQAIEGAMTKK